MNGKKLLDSEIRREDVDRRSFLRRATGVGFLAGAGMALAACEEVQRRSDRCDSDVSDRDPSDPVGGGGDRCDAD